MSRYSLALVSPRKLVIKSQSVVLCSCVLGRFLDEGIWKVCEVETEVLKQCQRGWGKMQDLNRSTTYTILKFYSPSEG